MEIDFVIIEKSISSILEEYREVGFEICKLTSNIYSIHFPSAKNRIIITDISYEGLLMEEILNEFHLTIKPDQQVIYFNNLNNSFNLNASFQLLNENVLIRKDSYINFLGYEHQVVTKKSVSDDMLLKIYKDTYWKVKKLLKVEPTNIDSVDYSYISIWFNHLLEFELNANVGIKTCIAESGKKLNTNVHDSDIWIEKLEYEKIPLAAAVNHFLTNREYNSYFLTNDKLGNFHYAGTKIIHLKDIIHNITSHTLEHLNDIEKILEENYDYSSK